MVIASPSTLTSTRLLSHLALLLFYVSLGAASKQASWLNLDYFWRFIYETSDKDRENPGKYPWQFFYISSNYLRKFRMGTLLNADIIDQDKLVYKSAIHNIEKRLDAFPVFFMSLGLACHKNNYSTIVKVLSPSASSPREPHRDRSA